MIEITMMPPPFNILPNDSVIPLTKTAGNYVFRQGDVSTGLYYLQTGDLELVRHTETGKKVTIHRVSHDETFAEASIFSNKYHCDCIVLSDCKIVQFRKSAILFMMSNKPDFAKEMLARFAVQIREARFRLELLSIKSAEDRVLVALSEFGQKDTVSSFASQIGLSHEATYRALSNLVKRRVVEKHARGKYRVI